MNLADMLCYADIDQLTRIAQTYDCDCGSHSKNELIQSILSVIHRRESLERQVEQMSGDDLRFLNSLLFENRMAYSLEELKARALGTAAASLTGRSEPSAEPVAAAGTPDQPGKRSAAKSSRSRKKAAESAPEPASPDETARQTITRFKRNGWLFNGFSQQTRYLYQVPDDVKQNLSDALERKFRLLLEVREEPPVYRDERSLMAEDLVVFLRYVRDNDVPLTTDGVLYKRQLGQVLELMAVYEEIPGRAGWRFGYGRKFRDYPDRFSLLYDYAYYEGLISENPDRLIATEEGLNAADGQTRIDPARLYRFWLRLYKGPIANLTALVQWVSRLADAWTTTSSLFGILKPFIRSYYYDQEKDVMDRRVLAMMMHLGLLRWGETAAGEAVVRMTPQGKAVVSGLALPFEDTLRLEGKPIR
ncbi:hypothetical protein GE107_11165 [Cohnella sp. CFH 77786]|uniref:hypothetical protein n=1 Tax=Cohnella sp. CFH 77786 TaxID=2662265 RepID=UPI001C609F14|nr:hypothetical protein [Cohnella sp. CFH 77786]MBW5446620.1 hypothetical protein [Cohnella sp. CFH 77786]